MPVIESVLGPLDSAELGFTLMHEHVLASAPGITKTYPELLGKGYQNLIVKELKKIKKAGINTIVDGTTFDLGRDVVTLADVSRKTGVNIIACAGWRWGIPIFLGDFSIDQIARLLLREVQVGIDGTAIKAGILKSAADSGSIKPREETLLRAVARVHLQTKVPIMLHSYPQGEVGKQQLSILREEGVDLTHVKVDHCCDTTDIEYLVWLLDQGCYLGMDKNPGMDMNPTFGASPLARIKTIKALIDAGYSSRLLLSHDATIVATFYDTMSEQTREEVKRRNPHGFLYIPEVVFPQLQEMGVPLENLKSICIDNPRRFFEGH